MTTISINLPPLPSEGHRIGPGRRTLGTYHRDHGKKWTGADLRAIRARNGVGRPPVAKTEGEQS